MSEGGCLAWKRQRIDTRRGPAGGYDAVHRALPSPPKGMHWVQDRHTKEWRVVKKNDEGDDVQVMVVAEAEPLMEATVMEVVEDEATKPTEEAELSSETARSGVVATSSVLPEAQLVDASAAPMKSAAANSTSPYLEHWIQDDVDTFAGICLRYKLTASELRRANFGFSGTNLSLAPNPLRIPQTPHAIQAAAQLEQDANAPHNVVRRLIKACPKLTRVEAKCYLELNDRNLQTAIENAKEDGF